LTDTFKYRYAIDKTMNEAAVETKAPDVRPRDFADIKAMIVEEHPEYEANGEMTKSDIMR
jgi:hypothetical protein